MLFGVDTEVDLNLSELWNHTIERPNPSHFSIGQSLTHLAGRVPLLR